MRARSKRVSESPEVLRAIAEQVNGVADHSETMVSSMMLNYFNRFSMEQGNDSMAARMNSILGTRGMNLVLGYHFIGGWVDPQLSGIRKWRVEDICGVDPGGEERG